MVCEWNIAMLTMDGQVSFLWRMDQFQPCHDEVVSIRSSYIYVYKNSLNYNFTICNYSQVHIKIDLRLYYHIIIWLNSMPSGDFKSHRRTISAQTLGNLILQGCDTLSLLAFYTPNFNIAAYDFFKKALANEEFWVQASVLGTQAYEVSCPHIELCFLTYSAK